MKISIIITTYNRPLFLKRALQSVIKQDSSDLEIVVVDNGGLQETKRIVEEFSNRKKDNSIKYIKELSKNSPSVARNRGIEEAKGQLIVFLDDDDELSSDFYNRIKQAKIDYNKPQIILTGFKFIYHFSKHLILQRKKPSRIYLPPWQRPIAVGSIFTKSVFKERRVRFDENLKHLEDLDISIQCDLKGIKVTSIEAPLYYVHVQMPWRPTSLTRGEFFRLFKDTNYFYEKYFQYYSSKGPKALAFLYYLRGMSLAKIGKIKEARKWFYQAAQLDRKIRYIGSFLSTFGGKKGFNCSRYIFFLLDVLT